MLSHRIHRVIWYFCLFVWLFLCSHPCVLVLAKIIVPPAQSDFESATPMRTKKNQKNKPNNIALICPSPSMLYITSVTRLISFRRWAFICAWLCVKLDDSNASYLLSPDSQTEIAMPSVSVYLRSKHTSILDFCWQCLYPWCQPAQNRFLEDFPNPFPAQTKQESLWAAYTTKTRELSRTVNCGCPNETCCIFASFAFATFTLSSTRAISELSSSDV